MWAPTALTPHSVPKRAKKHHSCNLRRLVLRRIEADFASEYRIFNNLANIQESGERRNNFANVWTEKIKKNYCIYTTFTIQQVPMQDGDAEVLSIVAMYRSTCDLSYTWAAAWKLSDSTGEGQNSI